MNLTPRCACGIDVHAHVVPERFQASCATASGNARRFLGARAAALFKESA